jgi:hypothetical protein
LHALALTAWRVVTGEDQYPLEDDSSLMEETAAAHVFRRTYHDCGNAAAL